MKQIEIEEKLMAQVKNIMTIINTPMPNSSKQMLLTSQREHLNGLLDKVADQYK